MIRSVNDPRSWAGLGPAFFLSRDLGGALPPEPLGDHPEPGERPLRAVGCGCSFPGHGLLLLGLTVALIIVLASNDELRGSLLWLVLVSLIVGMILLFVRVQRYRGP